MRRTVDVRQTLSSAPAAGDRRLVERLIAKLIDNAVSYNRPQGYVDARLGTRGGYAAPLVTNTGPVVPPAEVAPLLQPFQRNGPDRPERWRGLGLGLSIVQANAEAHDAALDVRPRAEGGLVVEVNFPEVTSTNGGPTNECVAASIQHDPIAAVRQT